MTIDFNSDPVLRLRRQQSGFEPFRAVIAAAVERHPGTAEAAAGEDEAAAALEEARAGELPTADFNLTSYRVLSRDFSNDPFNIIERSRPLQRTDATLSVTQLVFDFGATSRRIRAAGARLRAAGADLEVAADRTALNAVAAWYDVFAYRALVALCEAFAASQRDLRASVEIRIRQGVSAESDLARVDSYIAQADTRLAQFRRQLASAEARFTELTGAPAPPGLERAPAPGPVVASRDEAVHAADQAAAVRSAQAASDASRQDARAARADRLPQIAVGVDAGRYGVIENDRDYDIRGRVGLRYRIFGPTDARAEQYEARAPRRRRPRHPHPRGIRARRRHRLVRRARAHRPARGARGLLRRQPPLARRHRRAVPRRPRHPVRRGRRRGQLFRKRHCLHSGVVGIGRRAVRPAYPVWAGSSTCSKSIRTGLRGEG